MRLLALLLAALMLASLAGAAPWGAKPAPLSVHDNIRVDRVVVQADADGDFAELTGPVWGELLGIYYDKGNFTAVGTTTVKTSTPNGLTLDSYNVSTASAFRAVGSKVISSTDAWRSYQVIAPLWVNCSSVQAWGSSVVYIVWR